jgi:very-short-patch-repair endonuclease
MLVRKGDAIDMTGRLTEFARDLRKNATLAEAILWKELRSRQFEGVKFKRQKPIHSYIVDFVSFEKDLIIELNGGQHAEAEEKDIERDGILQQGGFTVLRFWNNEVLENLEGVLEVIREACLKARSRSSVGS